MYVYCLLIGNNSVESLVPGPLSRDLLTLALEVPAPLSRDLLTLGLKVPALGTKKYSEPEQN